MSPEEVQRLGHLIKPVKHSMKRRALWHDYSRTGLYLITIVIKQYDDGSYYEGTLLSTIHGSSNHLPPVPSITELPVTTPSYFSSTENISIPHPYTVPTELGAMVWRHIWQIGSHHGEEYVGVRLAICMPTHIHMILQVSRDLPFKKNGQQSTLGDIVRGFKQGCTSAFKRWLRGEPMELHAGTPRQFLTPPGATSDISLWEENYNDRNLLDDEALQNAVTYICMNAWRWKLLDDHPDMLRHLLHVTVAETEYSAYGCIFLLRHPVRLQVYCHRYVRKSQLTPSEWQYASQPSTAERLVREAIANKKTMGSWSSDWLSTANPKAVCPIPYHKTETFRRQKAELLSASQQNAVLVSPAVSPGEREIFYEALAQGGRCIKLQRKPLPAKAHPQDKDIVICAQGQLLVLGPWHIQQNEYRTFSGQLISNDSKFAQFHDLNKMAERLCQSAPSVMHWSDTVH